MCNFFICVFFFACMHSFSKRSRVNTKNLFYLALWKITKIWCKIALRFVTGGYTLRNVTSPFGHFYLGWKILSTLSLKRNAPWIHWLPIWPRVKVKWPQLDHILSQDFETGRKKPHSKKSNGSPDNSKSPRVCYMYSNFWILPENHEQFWNGVFAHCYQEHRQNEIY